MDYVKFIPYTITQARTKGAFYSLRKIFSFGCKIMLIIGARRTGKTFSAKEFCIKHWEQNPDENKFVWVRDIENATDEIAVNNGAKFFSDIFRKIPKYKTYDGSIDGKTININGKTAGYLVPASTFHRFKGTDYTDCNIIVLDEFIPETTQRIARNRSYEIINTFYTIASTRPDIRVIMIANAIDKNDELLHVFSFNVKNYGFYINRSMNAVLHYADNNPEFIEMQKHGVISKIISKTQYADNLLNAKFNNDESQYFTKRPAGCALLCAVHTPDGSARVYGDGDLLYISNDFHYDKILNFRYVRKHDQITYGRQLCTERLLNLLRHYSAAGLVRYQGGHVRNVFLDFIK